MADFQQVTFHEVKESYPILNNITCKYSVCPSFEVNEQDWIGFYKVGWKSINNFITCVLVPKIQNEATGYDGEVTFSAENIPSDMNEFYQFCYMSSSGQMCGASTPFQLHSSQSVSEDDIEIIDTESAGVIIGKTRNEMLEEQLAVAQDKNLQLEKELNLLKQVLQDERMLHEQKQSKDLEELNLLKQVLQDERMLHEQKQSKDLEELNLLKQVLQDERMQHEQRNNNLEAKLTKNDKIIDELKKRIEEERVKLDHGWNNDSVEPIKDPIPTETCPKQFVDSQLLLSVDDCRPDSSGQAGAVQPSSDSTTKAPTESMFMSLAGSVLNHLRNSMDVFGISNEYSADEKSEDDETDSVRKPASMKTSSTFPCMVCPATFSTEIELQEHLESHLGEVCPICFVQFDKGYPWENITDHVNRHLDDQPEAY